MSLFRRIPGGGRWPAAILIACTAFVSAAEPDSSVSMARATWDTGWFQSEVYAALLEELGYRVEGPRTYDNAPFFEAAASGEVDMWVNGWFPQHERYLPDDGSVRAVGRQVEGGAVQGILVDRASSEAYGVTSLSDLRDPAKAAVFDRDGDGKADLIGCNRGWACEEGIERHLSRLGLKDTVSHVQGDYSPLMGNVLDWYARGEPVLFYTWTPNWTLGRLRPGREVVWLEIEGGEADCLPDLPGCPGSPCCTGWSANDIRAVANAEFLARNPAVESLLRRVVIPIGDIQAQNARMIRGEDSLEDIRGHAREWIRDNRGEIDKWLREARTHPTPARGDGDTDAEEGESPRRVARVATQVLPPFVLYQDLAYRGFSIDLMRALCAEMDLRPDFVGVNSLAKLLDEVERGGVDFAASAVAITADRERRMDFSHSYFQSGLQILVPVRETGWLGGIAGRFGALLKAPRLLEGLMLFMLVVFAVAHMIWLVERRHNPQFPRGYLQGVFAGLWWAVVTVTTVGYGDKTPKGRSGRFFALVWLLAGYFVFAYFTASVTTTFTMAELHSRINSPADLFDQRVGVVADGAARDHLRKLGLRPLEGASIEGRIDLLEAGELDAVVHHAPYLQYYATHEGTGKVRVVGTVFAELDYGIAMPEGSKWREPMNRALLRLMESGVYAKIYDRWF